MTTDTIAVLWIKAKGLPRRCRAGFCFDADGYGIAVASLSDEQLEALKGDPYLSIEEGEAGDEAIGLLQHTGEIKGLEALDDYPGKSDTTTAESPAGGAAGAPPAETDEELNAREHTLRAYLADLKAGEEGKPKVAEAKAATGIADLTAVEVNAVWKALG